MASKRELQALIVLAGKVDPSLQKALKDAEKKTKSVDKTTKLFQKTADKAWKTLKVGVAAGVAAMGAAMVYFGKQGLELASDLSKVQNVVDTIFGDRAENINQWALSAKQSFGLSELAAKQFTGTYGAMMKNLGINEDHLVTMSTTLAGLAGDFASFRNIKPEEAFDRLKAVITGSTEPLEYFGVDMRAASLEAYRLAQGIETAYSEMDAASQVILRYNYLLSVAGPDRAGDFAKNIGDYANQTMLFKANLQDLATSIMRASLPAMARLVEHGNKWIESFANDPEKIELIGKKIADVFDWIVGAVPKAINAIGRFAGAIGKVFSAGYQLFQFFKRNWVVIEPIIWGIVSAMTAWKAITVGMRIYQGVMAAIRAGTVAAAIAQWGLNAAVLANPMTWIVAGISAAIGLLVAGFVALYRNWDTVQAFLVNTWTGIKRAWAAGVNWIVDKINWLIEKINKIPMVNIPLIPKIDTSAYDAAGEQADAIAASAPKLEGYAKGGLATRPSIFGEAGPEMAIPIKRTPRSIGLLNKTAQMLGVDGPGGGKGATFVFAPQISGGNAAEIERTLRPLADDMFAMFEKWWEERRREEL